MGFVHLHCHSDYSLGDSAARIEDYIEAAQEAGMKALAISDTNSIAGAVRFSELCKNAGIKPIIASELTFDIGSIVCIAMNEEGMNNLARLVSMAHDELSFEDIERHEGGLICLCGSALTKNLISGKREEAESLILWFKSIFGDRFYIELQDYGETQEKTALQLLEYLACDFEIECVCTNDVHYIKKGDADVYDTLCCIREGRTKGIPKPGGEYYFKTEAEMRALFAWCPEALENTSKIAERCKLDFIEYVHNRLDAPCPEVCQNPDEHLAVLTEKGLKKRFAIADGKTQTRLRDELSAIREAGCAGLFLVVHDMISWARQEGIAISAGRYPYVCSLVCYLLEITDINPIEYDLVFERFINWAYPQGCIYIPLMIATEGRTRILDYIRSRYRSYELAYAGCVYTEHDIHSAVSAIASIYGCSEFPSHVWKLSIKEIETFLKIWNAFSDKKVRYADSFIESVRKISKLKNGYSVQDERRYAYVPDNTKTIIWPSQKNSLPLICDPDYDLPIVDYDGYSPVLCFQITTSDYLQHIDDAEKIIRKKYAPDFDIRKINMADGKVFESFIPREPYEESYHFLSPVEEMANDFVTFKEPWHESLPYFWEILKKLRPQSISNLAVSIALTYPHANVDIDEYIIKENVSASAISHILSETNGYVIYDEYYIAELFTSKICTVAQAEYALRIFRENDITRINEFRERYVKNEMAKGRKEEDAIKSFYLLLYTLKDEVLPSKAQCVSCAVDTYRLAYIATNYPEVAKKVFPDVSFFE